MSDNKRRRLSVDLTPHKDVLRMMERAAKDGITDARITVMALREFLAKKGYARKKDLAQ